MKYDYLIVGAGLFGAICAYELTKKGKRCVVIDKRSHIGGNCYCENVEGINIHKYGAHIFHTSNKTVWDFINNFAEFNNYINSPMAVYKDEIYNLPFNMNTFSKIWNVKTPEEAKTKIDSQKFNGTPSNLEEQALSLVGKDIYEKLIKGYTEKQWGRNCCDLPAFIIKRLPLRFIYDNNYFNDRYQGIPIGGYNVIFNKLLKDVEVKLGVEYRNCNIKAENTIFTGPIDEFFDFKYGALEYRSVRFENKILNIENFQGNAVVNYTERQIPYTRIIEHKHFEFAKSDKTVISYEYPSEWKPGIEPYYPVNDEKNTKLLEKYQELSKQEKGVYFGGRLGQYRYFDMDKTIEEALTLCGKL